MLLKGYCPLMHDGRDRTLLMNGRLNVVLKAMQTLFLQKL